MIERRTTALALGCALACTFAVGVAIAEPAAAPVTLSWNAPPGCSDSAAIVDAVSRLRNGTAGTKPMSAFASVALDPSGVWQLHITTTFADGTSGERDLQAESCKAAADATASILALALTARAKAKDVATPIASASATAIPTTTATATPNKTATPNTTTTATARPTTTAVAKATAAPIASGAPTSTSRALPIRLVVGGDFGGTTGDLPSIGLGGGGSVGVLVDRLRIEGYADYFALAKARFAKPGGADFQLFSAGARTCLSFGGTFTLGPCAAFELGSMRGSSFDVTRPSSGTALTADALVGALGTFSLDESGHFALRALLEAGLVVDRPEFVLTGIGFVHEPAPVVGRGTVGAEIRF